MKQVDVLVIGAGAAGLFTAIEAGRRGRSVLVVDHAAAAGEKIRISGGGRCNFTNVNTGADRFLSKNPRFALSALKRYTAQDFVARVRKAGIAFHEKALGQLFCDGSAKQIVAMLLDDLADAGAELWLSTALGDVQRRDNDFMVQSERGPIIAASVIIATGGKSIPKMGATGFGYRIAERFDIPVTETRPGLVPLTFAEQELDWIKPLSGISLPVRVRHGKTRFDEALLFTHRGLSGPAILQISSFWREGDSVSLDLLPGQDVATFLRAEKQAAGRAQLRTALAKVLPEKLARHMEVLTTLTGPMAEMGRDKLDRVAGLLGDWVLTPVGSEGYRTAEVTLGGVDTDALDSRTMMAKTVPGLFFVGEVVDVTGWLGGYNFQWAWSSGWAAGQVA